MAVYKNILNDQFDRIIFMHIPKTAGSSFREYFRNVFGDDKVASLGGLLKGGKNILDIDYELIKNKKFLGGHRGYNAMRKTPGKNLFVSIIREPIARAVSIYKFVTVTSKPDNRLRKELEGKTFSECLHNNDVFQEEIRNRQVRALSHGNQDKTFAALKETLTQDNFIIASPESMQELAEMAVSLVDRDLDPSLHQIPSINISDLPVEVSSQDRDLIRELNQEDYALYNALKEQSL